MQNLKYVANEIKEFIQDTATSPRPLKGFGHHITWQDEYMRNYKKPSAPISYTEVDILVHGYLNDFCTNRDKFDVPTNHVMKLIRTYWPLEQELQNNKWIIYFQTYGKVFAWTWCANIAISHKIRFLSTVYPHTVYDRLWINPIKNVFKCDTVILFFFQVLYFKISFWPHSEKYSYNWI